MRFPHRTTGILAALLCLVASPPPPSSAFAGGSTRLAPQFRTPHRDLRPVGAGQRDQIPGYRQLLARGGAHWDLWWDEGRGTAAILRGSGLPLLDAFADAVDVELAARSFVTDHRELFGIADEALDLQYAERLKGDIWVAAFEQTYKGLPLWSSRLQCTFKKGRLILVRSSVERAPVIDGAPRLTATEALAHLTKGFPFLASARRVRAPRLYLYPQQRAGARPTWRPAWFLTLAHPQADVAAFIDAQTGEVLEAVDRRAYETGTARLVVDRRTVGDPQETLPMDQVTLSTSTGSTTTSDKGTFSSNGSGSTSASLSGPHVRISNQAGSNGSATGSATGLTFDDSNSHPAERDAYRAIMATNEMVRTVFPSQSWLTSRQITANVNINDACNAYYSPWADTVNFFQAGSKVSQSSGRKLTCNNTGRIFDVVSHEYGHGVDNNLPGGAYDGGLGEFIGDLMSFVQTGSSELGPGFLIAIDDQPTNQAVRYLDDDELNCYDSSVTEVHQQGEQLGQVVYDIMTDLTARGVRGQALRDILLLPIADAQSRSEWYDAMLVADDDDGNLANGTPNGCVIWGQFDAHSCGPTRWPGVPTTPVACYSAAGEGRQVYESATAVTIPDNDPAGIASTIDVPDDFTIADLDVYVELEHDFVGDLTLTLDGPASGTVTLHNRSGSSTDDIGGTFGRELTPAGTLDGFSGTNARGTWTLRVVDSAPADEGVLRRWRLEIR